MFREIKTRENITGNTVVEPIHEEYKEIKPEEITLDEAKDFWAELFGSM